MLSLKFLSNLSINNLKRLKSRSEINYLDILKKIKSNYKRLKKLNQEFDETQIKLKAITKIIIKDVDNKKLLKKAINYKTKNQKNRQEINNLKIILHNLQIQIPNIPHETVPIGDEKCNQVVFQKLNYPNQKFNDLKHVKYLSHYDILKKLNLLETKNTVQMSQTRFVTFQGLTAKLLRALKNFLLDYHIQNGYLEIVPPFLVNRQSLINTGQFPKAEADCYKLSDENLFLIPTAEVALVNLYAKKNFTSNQLPVKLCAYSPCFRQEAGAAGKDTQGIIRLHQFHKVELVQFCNVQNSYQCLDKMTKEITKILELLKIPYQIVNLATADLAFQAAKTFDLEVWWPSRQKFLEISSISNTETFQTTPLQIKLNDLKSQIKPELLHALNGSGLALDRLIAILIEYNYDVKTNQFNWPSILKKYLFN